MAISIWWKIGATLLASTLGACSGAFPGPPEWKAGDPNLYTLAFASSATEAFVFERTGRRYYDLLGNEPYALGDTGLCTAQGLDDYLVHNRSRCDVLKRAPSEDCFDGVQCIRLQISPVVLTEPRFVRVVESALQTPCASLTDWRTLKWEGRVSSNNLDARHSAHILRCGRDEVVGTSITREPNGQYYRIHFERRSVSNHP